MLDSLRYPIGEFTYAGALSPEQRQHAIATIAQGPGRLRSVVQDLTERQLDTPYRPGGWSVRQLVHHVADSHMNSYIRLKLALTEENPAIKPYDEAKWAELRDTFEVPTAVSLDLLDALTKRWVAVWNSMPPDAFARVFKHPEMGPVPLDKALALYAWHTDHHIAHIAELRKREKW